MVSVAFRFASLVASDRPPLVYACAVTAMGISPFGVYLVAARISAGVITSVITGVTVPPPPPAGGLMMQIAAPNEFDPVAVQFEFNAVPVVNVVVSSVNSMWNDDPEFVPVHGEFDDKLMLLGLFGEIHANAIPPTDADDGVIDGPVPGVVVPLDVTGAPPSNWLVPNVDTSTPDSS